MFVVSDLIKQESVLEIEADNEKWEALMATNESQALLDKMAVEALAEHLAGKTTLMAFINKGRILPG